MSCLHDQFSAIVNVGKLTLNDGTPTGAYVVDVQARCEGCGARLQFEGLPVGVDTHGATRSVDGTEARLRAIIVGDPQIVTDRIQAIFRTPEGSA